MTTLYILFDFDLIISTVNCYQQLTRREWCGGWSRGQQAADVVVSCPLLSLTSQCCHDWQHTPDAWTSSKSTY